MRQTIDIIKVFAASPSSTVEERKIIVEVVSDINRHHGKDANFRIDLIMWEEDSYPSVGVDSQDVINKQLSDYDIFLGLMGSHFGSPTKRAKSGTEEEFDRAYEKYREFPSNIHIMFYFRNSYVKMLDININQLIEIHRFKERISDLGVLYQMYETVDEFRRKLTNQLLKTSKEFIKNSINFETRNDSKIKKVDYTNLKTINLNDWLASTKKLYPQWANYLEITLSQYNFKNYILKGTFNSKSKYFRFGFKFLTQEGRLFGDGSIKSQDNNFLIHIGKNIEDPNLFLTTYENGIRQTLNKPLFDYSNSQKIQIELQVSSNNVLQLFIDKKEVFEILLNPAIKQRILVISWGDEHEYSVDFENITIQLS